MKKITVFTTLTCPFCKMLMAYLTEKGLLFEEKKVDESKENEAEMIKYSGGFLGVPFTVIETTESLETVIGFDKAKLDALLG